MISTSKNGNMINFVLDIALTSWLILQFKDD